MKKLFTFTFTLLIVQSIIAQDIQSNAEGFSLNINASAATWNSGSFFLGSLDEEEPLGVGINLKAGYGITQNIEVFISYAFRTFSFNDDFDTYSNQTVDIGGRYNFGATLRKFRPFAEASLTINSFTMDPIVFDTNNFFDTFKLEVSGLGGTIGGGFHYFFVRNLSGTLNAKAVFGTFDEVTLSGEEVTGLEEDLDYTLYIFQLGLTYFFE